MLRTALRTRRLLSTTLADKCTQHAKDLAALPEVVAAATLRHQLETGTLPKSSSRPTLDAAQTELVVDAGLATFHLHVEARVAAYCGEGFYTIGPCGEELLGAVGLVLEDEDGCALHYRHLATNVVRCLRRGDSLEDLLLARARGYCVSSEDPACGGAHCCVGGGANDWLVTSTLASQAPRAVGRALADTFRPRCERTRQVEYVSVGDGSVNNGHFLSAVNFAEYVAHRDAAVPVVFAVADNDASISLAGHGWLPKFVEQRLGGCEVFRCDGADGHAVFRAAAEAFSYARNVQRPAVLIFENLPRRFGHAATDRQDAYLPTEEIARRRACDPLAGFIGDGIAHGLLDADTVTARSEEIALAARNAFDIASAEPKHDDRAALVSRLAAPLAPVPPKPAATPAPARVDVLRKHATRVLDELLTRHDDVVYVGEDVEHGGYYLVTEGLKANDERRVRDFPPDETALLGAAAGLAQRGLVPIVEVPYAKYLDCGFDQFAEIALMHWLSDGRQANGMVIRMQGFDRGLFGGNFHTHNWLPLLPGVDVVATSNGRDYARAMRHAVRQARAGRVVMMVDATYLLNLRHVHARDEAWLTGYPGDDDELAFDAVIARRDDSDTARRVACVTWGTGVVAALRARKLLDGVALDIFEQPCLTWSVENLAAALAPYDAVVFADPCKPAQCPLMHVVLQLQDANALPTRWRLAAAQPTYNPLGRDLTFLSTDDVAEAVKNVLR